MAFPRRSDPETGASPHHRIDHALLVATLSAARVPAAPGKGESGPAPEEEEVLTELLTAGPAWREAAAAQRGCFSRAVAGRGVNGR